MKYKQGEKMIVEITEVKENSYVLNKIGEVESMEAKIRRQAAEITRLLTENKELKERVRKANKISFNGGRLAGQNEAWELAKKIVDDVWNGGYSEGKLKQIFGYAISQLCIVKNTYQEAAAKVAEWEKAKEEIKVGDVCMSNAGNCFAIRTIDHEKGNVEILWEDLSSGIVTLDFIKSHCTNTDRRIDIDSISQQIGGKEK